MLDLDQRHAADAEASQRAAALEHREPEQIAVVVRQAIEIARDQADGADVERRAAGKGGRGGGIGCVHGTYIGCCRRRFNGLLRARRVAAQKIGLVRLFCSSAIFHQESSCSEWFDWTACAAPPSRSKSCSKRNGFRHFDWNLLHVVLGQNGHPLCRIFRRDGDTAPGARATVRASADVCDRENSRLLAVRRQLLDQKSGDERRAVAHLHADDAVWRIHRARRPDASHADQRTGGAVRVGKDRQFRVLRQSPARCGAESVQIHRAPDH